MATSRTWVASRGIAASGARRLRHAGADADVGEPDAARRAGPWRPARRWPTGRRPRRGRSVRPRTTTSSGPASLLVGGNRYHADRSTAGCCVPPRQLPITGVRARVEAVRQPRPGAVDPRCRGRAALGARLASGRPGPSVSAKLPVPWGSMTGSADTSAGIPLGSKPCAVTEPSASPTGTLPAGAAGRRWDPVRP